jgi:Leucine-rich repeat (LRR) protein
VVHQLIWNLPVPLDEPSLARTGVEPTLVQFSGGLIPTERDHRLLGEFLAVHPATTVRFYGAHLAPNLGSLSHYSFARRVNLDVDGVTSFEPLGALSSGLDELTLGPCGTHRLSLAPVRRFTALRTLSIVRHQRDIDAVATLARLERLTLISLKLPSLDLFEPLTSLHSFELKLGGTTDLAALPRIGRLRYVEIYRVIGLDDLSVLAELTDLEYLFLQHLKRVERLPSLASCKRLRRVHLDRVYIQDLAPLAAAPRLEELLLLDMPQLGLDAFEALVDHPALRALTAGVRNETLRAEIRALLGLEDVSSYGTEFEFALERAAG